jgi:hypothetical protein
MAEIIESVAREAGHPDPKGAAQPAVDARRERRRTGHTRKRR